MSQPSDVVREVIDRINQGDLDAAEKLLAPGAVNHAAVDGAPTGPAGFRPGWEELRGAFPDWAFVLEESVENGELVANSYTVSGTQRGEFAGQPPSGRSFRALGLDLVRVHDGLVTEHWALFDLPAMGTQLGWAA